MGQAPTSKAKGQHSGDCPSFEPPETTRRQIGGGVPWIRWPSIDNSAHGCSTTSASVGHLWTLPKSRVSILLARSFVVQPVAGNIHARLHTHHALKTQNRAMTIATPPSA